MASDDQAGSVLAPQYNALARYSSPAIRKVLAPISQAITFPDPLILDIGAGTGVPGNLLRDLIPGAKCVAVDISFAMLSVAKSNHSHSMGYVQADALQLPFRSGSVDAVVVVAALHLFGNIRESLEEIARVLKLSGCVLLIVYLPEHLKAQLFHQFLPRFHALEMTRHFDKEEIQEAASAAGLRLMDTVHADFIVKFESPQSFIAFIESRPFFGMHALSDAEFESDINNLKNTLSNVPHRPLTSQSALTGLIFERERL